LKNEIQAHLEEVSQRNQQDAGTEEQIAKLTEFNDILQGFNDQLLHQVNTGSLPQQKSGNTTGGQPTMTIDQFALNSNIMPGSIHSDLPERKNSRGRNQLNSQYTFQEKQSMDNDFDSKQSQ
jgi:hypothetical protein